MFQWIRAFAQTTTYLGVAVIASIWCGVFFLTHKEHERTSEEGVRQASNLVRVFEAYISRVLGGADSTLLTLRDSYEHDQQHFDIAHPVSRTQFQNNIVMQFGIDGPDGLATLSSMRSIRSDERVSEIDRDYFRFHSNSKTDELYISAPSVGRVLGKLVFHLTRRLTAPDGSFGGVILATIDILQLERFYNSIDIGRGGVISLVGFDGIVRARSGRDPGAKDFVGRSNAQTQVFSLFRQSPAGSYWNFEKSEPQFEGVRRLISYQVVEGFPLVAVVGLAESDIFQQATATAHEYYLIALVVTAIVIAAIGIGARRQRRLSSTVAALERSNLCLEQSKLSLEQTNVWFNTALENMAHGLCMFDCEQRLLVCNERYSDMYGLTRNQTKPGTTLRSILEARVAAGNIPGDSDTFVEQTLEMTRRPEPYYAETELHDKRIFALNYQPMQDGGWVGVHQDITAQKRAETQIAYMARHDALTNIANRAALMEKMEEALARLRRRGDAFTIFLLDLDLFKTVNDSLGHPVGDELLKVVARRLSACLPESDTVARLGGDEFAILAMAEGDQREAAIVAAKRLLKAVAAPYDLDGHYIDIGTSIGIALAPEHGNDVDQLVKSADLALYTAKAEGRDTFRFFEESMGTEVRTRRTLQTDLRTALTNDEFELHYHPIVDIKTRETTSVEALVRWRHPQRGMIAPGGFIPLAEETGLINPIGEWVVRKACSDAVSWPSQVKVSVNLSPVQFRKVSPIDVFCRAITDSGLAPERLEVEITESVLLHGNAENVETLHQLRRMGISIVLDDFGTGYSSLSYLRMFPFDKIKIDRSFVNELSKNSDCAAIVSAVAGLGRSLQIGTVAEGIETEHQLVLVRAAGCTHAQGFLFGRPCPVVELDFKRFGKRKQKGTAA
jgi:diguanylate cyclase (GGDEF)-like protein/PAS domain S-box-containing protein